MASSADVRESFLTRTPAQKEEDQRRARAFQDQGIVQERRKYTDVCWCCLFVLYLTALIALGCCLFTVSDSRRIDHGHDHEWNLCGIDKPLLPFTYYPRIEQDFLEDPSLRHRYGVCVEACPQVGSIINDYGAKPLQPRWFVPLPSFHLFGRCVPYDMKDEANKTRVCAYPSCNKTVGLPTHARQVCGPAWDGSDKYWLLEAPDTSIKVGWRAEGASDELIQKRIDLVKHIKSQVRQECIQDIVRNQQVVYTPPDQETSYLMLTQLTGVGIRAFLAVKNHMWLIVGLGVGLAVAMSFTIVLLFPFCARVTIYVLLLLLFAGLVVLDYILFIQAGLLDDTAGRYFNQFLENNIGMQLPDQAKSLFVQASDSDAVVKFYKWAAWIGAVLIIAFFVIVINMCKQINVLIQLLHVAADIVTSVPCLLLFPLVQVISMIFLTACVFIPLSIQIVTIRDDKMEDFLERWHSTITPDDAMYYAQRAGGVFVLLGYLWVYFFHVGFCTMTTAHVVRDWYFDSDRVRRAQNHDSTCCFGTGTTISRFTGATILKSGLTIARMHAGSLAYGSFLLALCALPRIILEYLNNAYNDSVEHNPCIKCVVKIMRCVLWCFQKCLEFITDYAYIFVAVHGESFCSSAKLSWGFMARYLAQVAINTVVTRILSYVVQVTVPVLLVLVAWVLMKDVEQFWACLCVIFVLGYIIARLAIGVYDVIVTAVFVCAIMDFEDIEGGAGRNYMPEKLEDAFGFKKLRLQHEAELASLDAQQ